jgi:mRNA degradation ribonuclease J1/J2
MYTMVIPNFVYSAQTANPNLRAHLESHHEAKYVAICLEKGWPMQLAKRKVREATLKQSTLDGIAVAGK